MNLRKTSLLTIVLGLACFLAAQEALDIKVRKAHLNEFYYKDLPVAPQALERMFPSLSSGSSADSVDLRIHPFLSNSYQDTAWYLNWETKAQRQRTYRSELSPDYYRVAYRLDSVAASYFQPGYAEYIVLGTTASGKFIVLSVLNNGGSLTQCYAFIVEVRGDMLIKRGMFEMPNIRDYSVVINGNKIINGPNSYEIPVSAR